MTDVTLKAQANKTTFIGLVDPFYVPLKTSAYNKFWFFSVKESNHLKLY